MQCGFYEKAAVDCSQVEDAEDPGKKKAPAKPRLEQRPIRESEVEFELVLQKREA